MTDRVKMRRNALVHAKKIHETVLTPYRVKKLLLELNTDEFTMSLFEFVAIMTRVELGKHESGLFEHVKRLSRLTYPHTPDLAPFAQFWHATFANNLVDWLENEGPFSPSLSAVQIACHEDPWVWPQMLKMGPDCCLFEIAEEIARERIGTLPTDPISATTNCSACSAEMTLANFMTAVGLTCSLPGSTFTSQLIEEEGSWENWLPTNPGNERVDSLGQDHFVVEVARESGIPGMPGMISVAFGLGRVLLEAHAETPPDLLFNEKWIERWNERMEIFQAAIRFTENLEGQFPTSPNAEPRRLVRWSYIDLPSRGTNFARQEFFDSFNYVDEVFDSIQPFPEQTWFEMFQLKMRTNHYPAFADDRLQQAERERANPRSTPPDNETDEDPPDPGTTVPELSLEEKEKFLARYADDAQIQGWSDNEIYFGICMGM